MHKGAKEFAGRRIPELHGPVEAGRGQPPAIRAERHRADGVPMRRKGAEQPPGFRVPKGLALSRGAARRQEPVAAERHGDRVDFVSGQGLLGNLGLILLPVPDSHRPLASRCEVPPVGRTERHGIRRSKLAKGVTRSSEHYPLGRQIPDLHQPVRAGGREVKAVGMKGDAARALVVRRELPDDLTRPAVPDSDGPVPTRGGESFSVGAERHAVNFGLVPEDQRFEPAEPHQVMPFPLAQVFRALLEKFQGPAQVISRQVPVG